MNDRLTVVVVVLVVGSGVEVDVVVVARVVLVDVVGFTVCGEAVCKRRAKGKRKRF